MHQRTTAELAHIVPKEVPIVSPQAASATVVSHFTSTSLAPIGPDAAKDANLMTSNYLLQKING